MPRGGSRKPLRGYTRISRARGGGWTTRSGVRITDYEYRNRTAKKQGWKSAYEVDKYRRSPTWKKWMLDVARTSANYEIGPHGEEIYVGPDLTWRGDTIRDAYVVDQRRLKGDASRSGVAEPLSQTELGRMLIATGRRDEDAWWGSGDTP